jgi:hypothetical protein
MPEYVDLGNNTAAVVDTTTGTAAVVDTTTGTTIAVVPAASLQLASEAGRYPEFRQASFEPMGTYLPPVRMDSTSKRFYGYGKHGAPVYVQNVAMHSSSYIGTMKDGSPVFVSMDLQPINVLATAAIACAGLALGWLVTGAATRYLK